jgi:endonuclease/exonuclease/phosphatase family metal-dependent hydrolase
MRSHGWKAGWIFLLVCAGCIPSSKTLPPEASTGLESPTDVQSVESSTSISILAWNVESGGSDPQVIAQQLKELGSDDIVCLSEVDPTNFELFRSAMAPSFSAINGRTGRSDSLQILYDSQKFEALQTEELETYRDYTLNNGTHRSPLYVRLSIKGTDKQIVVMVNHLARGNAELRKMQAIGLREWARDQDAPLVSIGDFNMDFDFRTERGNDAFPEMIRDSIWTWVRPKELVDTNWADRGKDGVDDYPDSMLDFAFVAGPAKTWTPECVVVVRSSDFPDDDKTSDHRPIRLTLKPR